MKKFLRILFLLPLLLVSQQSRQVDSLIASLVSSKEDTNKIKTLGRLSSALRNINKKDSSLLVAKQALYLTKKLGWKIKLGKYYADFAVVYSSLARYDSAQIYYKTAIAEFEKLKVPHTTGIFWCLNRIANDYEQQADYPMAIEYYDKVLLRAVKVADSVMQATAFLGKGNVYYSKGDYTEALLFEFKALKLAEKIKSKSVLASVYSSLANIYNDQGDLKKSLDYNLKALKLMEEGGEKTRAASIIGNIANIYGQNSELEKALEYYNKAVKLNEETGNKTWLAINFSNMGNVYGMKSDYTSALSFYSKGLKLHEEMKNKLGVSNSLCDVGTALLNLGKFKEAEEKLLRSLAISKEINAINLTRNQELSLSNLYDTTGRYELALEHYKKYIAARDTINSQDNQKNQVRTEMNYEFGKKEAVIKEQQEKERAVAAEKNRFQKIVISSVAGGLVLVLIFAAFVFRTLKKTRLQKIMIEEKQKEILDSIYYARRIQRALLTSEKYIKRKLNELN